MLTSRDLSYRVLFRGVDDLLLDVGMYFGLFGSHEPCPHVDTLPNTQALSLCIKLRSQLATYLGPKRKC